MSFKVSLFGTVKFIQFLPMIERQTNKGQIFVSERRGHFHSYQKIQSIYRIIAEGNYPSVKQIIEKTEISRRSVFRYIEYLKELNAPLKYNRKRKGYYFTDLHWQLPTFTLTEGDLLAFFIAEQALRLTGHSPQAQQLRKSLSKLAALLPMQVSVNLSTLGTNISFQTLPFASANPQILELLTKAAINQQIVKFDYYSPHNRQWSHRIAGILLLHNFIGDWFAVSFDQDKRETRDFHVGRMKNVRLMEKEAIVPDDFDAEVYLAQGFFMMKGGKLTEVSILFDDYQAQWIRERGAFHPQEEREELADGSLRLKFKIGEMGLEAVARFCLTYAGNCRVEKPETLKQIMNEKLLKGLNINR